MHQFLSIFMTLLVTMSSFSTTIRSHYCGDDLIEVSLFSDSEDACVSGETCSMKQETENYECCYNIFDIVESHVFLKTDSFDSLTDIQKNLLIPFIYSEIHLFDALPKKVIPNQNYKSPPLIYDIHSLDEVYLI